MSQQAIKKGGFAVTVAAGVVVLLIAQIVTRTYHQVPDGVWNYCIGVVGGIVGFILSVKFFNKFVFNPLASNPQGSVPMAFLWTGIAFVVTMSFTIGTTWLAQTLFAK